MGQAKNSQKIWSSFMNAVPKALWFRPTDPHGCPLEPPRPYSKRTGGVRGVQATGFEDCRFSCG